MQLLSDLMDESDDEDKEEDYEDGDKVTKPLLSNHKHQSPSKGYSAIDRLDLATHKKVSETKTPQKDWPIKKRSLSASDAKSSLTEGAMVPENYVDRPSMDGRSSRHTNMSSYSVIYDEDHKAELARRIPWRSFFTEPAALVLFGVFWVQCWITYLMLSELPTYFNDVLGFDMATAGALAVVPYITQFISSISFGQIFDFLQQKHNWSTRNVRQCAQFISMGGAGLSLLIVGLSNQVYLSYFFIIISLTCLGAGQSGKILLN